MAMTLARLCAPWGELQLSGAVDTPIAMVTADSRRAGPEKLFVAVPGHATDGHRYVADAIAAGCPAVMVATARRAALFTELGRRRPDALVIAPRTEPYPALLARELAGRPDEALTVAGVTGTNGKTAVAFLLQAMLGRLTGRCGLLGTIYYDDGRDREPAALTTPGGEELYRWLGRMRGNGCRAVALEISSHALDQERTAGLAVDVAVLTNLGRDHLDYHGDAQRYLAAKARILDLLRADSGRAKPPGAVALNAADAALASLDTTGLATVRFCAEPAAGEIAQADLRLLDADLTVTGTRLTLAHGDRPVVLSSGLVGRYNVENLTAAVAAGLALGYSAEACAAALTEVTQVPGRMERFDLPSGALAVVDYAHTPDALAAVLRACAELTDGRLIVVFGCGGDRDRGKRPLMGAVAAREADVAWITSDNPRSEQPQQIIAEIVVGFDEAGSPRTGKRQVVVDRSQAITAALASAEPTDIVIIAGKGHEDYQLVGDRRLDLDDRRAVTDWIARSGDDD